MANVKISNAPPFGLPTGAALTGNEWIPMDQTVGSITTTIKAQLRIAVTAAGNITINAPSSGIPLVVNNISGGNYGFRLTNGTEDFRVYQIAGNCDIRAVSNSNLRIFTNNTPVAQFYATGGLLITAPSSGTGLTVRSLTTANSLDLGITGSTKNPRIYVSHTEATGVSDINFTGSTGLSGSISVGGSQAIALSGGGNVTIKAPSSGTPLTINGVATTTLIQLNPADSNSPALRVLDPGANGTDFRLETTNSTVYFQALGTNTQLILQTSGGVALTLASTKAATFGGTLAINGGTPTTKPTGYGSPSGTPTASITSASTLAQVAGTLGAFLAYMKTIGFVGA